MAMNNQSGILDPDRSPNRSDDDDDAARGAEGPRQNLVSPVGNQPAGNQPAGNQPAGNQPVCEQQPEQSVVLDDVVQATVRAILMYEGQRPRSEPPREPPRHVRPTLKNSEIAELLPEFNGFDDDVEYFLQRVYTIQSVYDVPDTIIPVIVAGKLTGHAKKWFQSKIDYVQMDWDTLSREMIKIFKSRPSKMVAMRAFEQRRWKKNEKFSSYFSDKVYLGNKAAVDDEDMVDYIVDGFDNHILQSQARMQQFRSPTDLLQVMQSITNEDKGPNVTAPNPRRTQTSRGTPRPSTPGAQLRCYNCNQTGHVIKDCLKPKRAPGSCFECGASTHRVKDCPRKGRGPIQSEVMPADSTTHVVTEAPVATAYSTPILLKLRETDKYRVELLALIDSGSPISLITDDIVPAESIDNVTLSHEFFGVNQSRLQILGMFKRVIYVQGVEVEISFHVVPTTTMSTSVLLGRDLLRNSNLKVVLGESVEIISKSEPTVNQSTDTSLNEILQINIGCDSDNTLDLDVGKNVSHKDRIDLKTDLLNNYLHAEKPDIPETHLAMKLQVKSEHTPFYFHARRLSYSDKLQLSELLHDLCARGIIEKSNSPYASPIVLVRRKSGAIRMCVDYRELNKLTERDNYPLPLIDDLVDRLKDKRYYTRLDLRDAFHHIAMEPDSIKYTSFVTPLGQYHYLKMPFGLKNSPVTFMRFVNTAFRDLIDAGKVVIYIDDILIATETIEENLSILNEVYEVLVRNLLTLKLDKCSFLQSEILYLGYKIDVNGITPSPENVKSVVDFPKPSNFKTLRSFLGLCSYFRRFVPNFALMMKPLYDLLKTGNKPNAPFDFRHEQLEAFDKIKEVMSSSPVLSIYSPLLETELHCDASAQGFASILLQRQEDGHFHPVFYFSRRTTPAEAKYHSFELETLAIVYSLERFKIYLQGIKFKIISDCNSLKLTLAKKEVNPRILRWTLILNNFDFILEHRRNERMRHVDALSRCFFVSLIAENSFEKILGLMQEKDTAIVGIREQLQSRDLPNYELRDGLVYRKDGKRLLFYVPSSMIPNVIRTCHDDVGHPGLPKVTDLISKTYWFPNLVAEVKSYLRNCLKCITYSPHSGKHEGYLHPIPKGDLPFQTLHVDHLGPLAETGSHYKYVFVVVDAFSRFTKLFPCKTTNAKEVLKHLSAYFSAYSRPMRIIADRDSTFRSSEFKDFLDKYSIQLVLIARRTPRGNGQVERFNRTLKPMLAKLSLEINKWDRALEDVEFGLNNTVCRSTDKCPSELVFGLRQKGKVIDLMRDYLESLTNDERDFADIRLEAVEKNRMEQQLAKRYYDKKHKAAHVYEVGDYIMCTNLDVTPGVNKKLLPQYKGPYEVAKKLPNDRYLIRDIPGFQLTQIPYEGVAAASDMRPFLDVP